MNNPTENYERDNEAQIISLFTEYLREEAHRLSTDFHDFALGSQDVELGADWLYHADSRFLIIEYKASSDGFRRESSKPRREQLCILLAKQARFRAAHRKCHYLAWSTGDSLQINIYEDQVCNALVFPQSCPKPKTPATSNLMDGAEFASRILARGSKFGLPLDEFETYAEWLMIESSGSRDGSIQLIARNRSQPGFRMMRFDSLRDFDAWFKETKENAPGSGQFRPDAPDADPDEKPGRPRFGG
ncbi:hypothetical protein [Paraburkholderia caribensis]|uniref:hypothetical protein n=1 Tax=Paraburkholderia caribensis TaxID=75105 RepID=UPI00078D4F60|nr:hypothetical protein [Paraburkholderia caribensis]AMV47801.1 hypothetical protein ATN79_44855 [Paraburkholderia caribensis]